MVKLRLLAAHIDDKFCSPGYPEVFHPMACLNSMNINSSLIGYVFSQSFMLWKINIGAQLHTAISIYMECNDKTKQDHNEMSIALVWRLLSVKECKVNMAGMIMLKHTSESIALSNQFLYTLIIITIFNWSRQHMSVIVAI